MGKAETVASVLLDVGIDKTLDYRIPEGLTLCRGMRVKVPLKGHLRLGTILALKDKSEFPSLLPISEVLDNHALPKDLYQLALWMQEYYLTPLRQILKLMIPSSIRSETAEKKQYFVSRKLSHDKLRTLCTKVRTRSAPQAKVLDFLLLRKSGLLLTELLEKTGVSKSPIDSLVKLGAISLKQVAIDRSPLVGENYFKSKPKKLIEEQKKALDKINNGLIAQKFETHLVHGVTGSGKTEVYLCAIDQALKLGKGVIMLVPEISLTPQTIERFRSRFENEIAILHHRLSKGQRRDEWFRIQKGEAKIVIGARSALFSPVPNLGLIIVDEEHDSAYKQQDERPTYHGRDMAVMRGKLTNSVVILGSATPSLESYHNALSGKYHLSTLLTRPTHAKLPSVTIVDMKREFEKAKGYTSFSELLIGKIKTRVEKGEQTILFLNRRGYHTSMRCLCGHIFKCPHCDLSLTFHSNQKTLACHLCDYRITPPPTTCPSCQETQDFSYKGVGTEQVERAIHAVLPEVRTLRVDGDTTRHKGSHERLFRQFRTGKADVMIGTQMIAKGLHFPLVTLVAILNSDSALNIPDFRASEQTFQLITQVAGRAGRGELPGEVVIQTQLPTNPTIELASKQDYVSFYKQEIEIRETFGFPPYTHLVKLTFSNPNSLLTEQVGNQFRNNLSKELSGCIIHPLVPSGHPKVRDQFRFQFLIRGPIVKITRAIRKVPYPTQVKLHLDIDSISTFF
ncbi:MAG: Primosomal protein N' [Chlamydiales bacterium]|nr:Primosomal protein N' [Chlamydiales bacterium]MCH9619895.1 Primosomal protein N' [Chlamydiales bacterium]MCH9622678.1 Primosomal protein N' [Chlamydiales bacterium]